METIIGLLFVLLPVIFKLVGKKLEQSGTETPILDWLEGKPKMDKDMYVEYDDDGHVTSVQPRDKYVPKQPDPIVAPVYVREPAPEGEAQFKPVSGRKPMLEEEVQVKKGEKIDPKKLVIYSEIMKPKF